MASGTGVALQGQLHLSHDLVGKDVTGEGSFAQYIKDYFGRKE